MAWAKHLLAINFDGPAYEARNSLARAHKTVAVVALANKLTRITVVVLRRRERFATEHCPCQREVWTPPLTSRSIFLDGPINEEELFHLKNGFQVFLIFREQPFASFVKLVEI